MIDVQFLTDALIKDRGEDEIVIKATRIASDIKDLYFELEEETQRDAERLYEEATTPRPELHREHECWDCDLTWPAPVKMGPTTNLSGEVSQYCPKCGKKSNAAYPVKGVTPRPEASWIIERKRRAEDRTCWLIHETWDGDLLATEVADKLREMPGTTDIFVDNDGEYIYRCTEQYDYRARRQM